MKCILKKRISSDSVINPILEQQNNIATMRMLDRAVLIKKSFRDDWDS